MDRTSHDKQGLNWPRWATLTFALLAVLVSVYQLRLVDFYFSVDLGYWTLLDGVQGWLHTLNHVGDALLLLVPYWLLPSRRRQWQWVVIVLLTVWSVSQVLYHSTYKDIMPYSSFTFVQNVNGMLLGSIRSLFKAYHLKLVAPPLALLLVDVLLLRHGIKRDTWSWRQRWRAALASVLAFVVLQAVVAWGQYREEPQPCSVRSFLTESYTTSALRNDTYYLNHGYCAYTMFCMGSSIAQMGGLSADQQAQVQQFLSQQPQYSDNAHWCGRDNVLFIVVESLNAWAVGATVDGRSVTPVLDGLIADSASTIVCRHVRSQVQAGRSSDGLFMYNTGLLPLVGRSVSMFYGGNTFPSLLQSSPRFASSAYVCGDPPSYWNMSTMAAAYGYTQFWGEDSLHHEEVRDDQLRDIASLDRSIMQMAGDVVTGMQEPFMVQVMTAGMHLPYSVTLRDAQWVTQSGQYTLTLRRYLQRVAILDMAVGELLQRLRDAGLLERTLVVIASDHNQDIDDDDMMMTGDMQRGDCLLLIANARQGMTVPGPMGQIDVYPTVLDVMGANQYGWKGLGTSVLRHDVTAASPSPDVVDGNTDDATRRRLQQAWGISQWMISGNWFKDHTTTTQAR